MTKINSQYIKNNVKCKHCQSTNLKRSHKQSFKSGINSDLEFNEQKFEWRQFECKDCGEITNVLNTDQAIVSVTEEAVLPFSAFDYNVMVDHEMVSLSLFYKQSINGEVIHDDIREEHIFMFEELFNKLHIEADNIMENVFQLLFDPNQYNFNENEEVLDFLHKTLKNAGARFNRDLIDYDEEEFEDLEWEPEKVYQEATNPSVSCYELEIYDESEFESKYPLLVNLIYSHFKEENENKSDFEFCQCLISFGNIQVTFAHKDNEDFTYYYESSKDDILNGEYEFETD